MRARVKKPPKNYKTRSCFDTGEENRVFDEETCAWLKMIDAWRSRYRRVTIPWWLVLQMAKAFGYRKIK